MAKSLGNMYVMHICMWGHPHTPTSLSIHPPTSKGDHPNQELMEIIQFCEDLESSNSPTYGWVDGWGQLESLKIK